MNIREDTKSKRLRIFYNILGWFLAIFFLSISIFNIVILSQSIFSKSRAKLFGYYYIIASNDNMKGDVSKGDIVLLKDVKDNPLQVGDVIEIRINGISDLTKIVALEESKVRVKQNNSEEVATLELDNDITGVLATKIAFFGQFAMFTQSALGIIIFLVIPLLALIGYVVLEIVRKRKGITYKQSKLVKQNSGGTATKHKKNSWNVPRAAPKVNEKVSTTSSAEQLAKSPKQIDNKKLDEKNVPKSTRQQTTTVKSVDADKKNDIHKTS